MAVETKVDQLRDTASLLTEALEGNRYWPGVIAEMRRTTEEVETLRDDIVGLRQDFKSFNDNMAPYKDLPERIKTLEVKDIVKGVIIAALLLATAINTTALVIHISGGG